MKKTLATLGIAAAVTLGGMGAAAATPTASHTTNATVHVNPMLKPGECVYVGGPDGHIYLVCRIA